MVKNPKITVQIDSSMKEILRISKIHPGHAMETGIRYLMQTDKEDIIDRITEEIENLVDARASVERGRWNL